MQYEEYKARMEKQTRKITDAIYAMGAVVSGLLLGISIGVTKLEKKCDRLVDEFSAYRCEEPFQPAGKAFPEGGRPIAVRRLGVELREGLDAGVGDERGHDDDVGPGLVVDDIKRIDEAGAPEVNEAQGVAPREPSLLPGSADAAEKFGCLP